MEPIDCLINNTIAVVFEEHVRKHGGMIVGAGRLQSALRDALLLAIVGGGKRRKARTREELVFAVGKLGACIMDSTKRQAFNQNWKLAAKQERAAIAGILVLLGVSNPTDAEIDSCVPG